MHAWYNVNTRKALETILWFVQRQGWPIDFFYILKALFFADKKHLNEYGHPILGDTYEAYLHGPVARTVYSLMKQDDPLETQFLAEQAGLTKDYPIVVTGDIGTALSVTKTYWSQAAMNRGQWNDS
jgi:uncharacterized phage-associated protein